MKNNVLCVMVLGTLLLVGCGSKKDANEKNFSEAINAYLAKRGQLCLGITSTWPVDLNESERRMTVGRAPVMAALEKIGLLRSHETTSESTPLFSARPIKVTVLRYELTEEGKKFYREKQGLSLPGNKETQGDLCYGQQDLDKIVKWQGPTAVGDAEEASVFYTYKIDNLADWAMNPDVQRVFPGIVPTIDGAAKTLMNQALTLTNQGWQAKGFDSPF
jgi:hypothetical protein